MIRFRRAKHESEGEALLPLNGKLIAALRAGTPGLLLFILWRLYEMQQQLDTLCGLLRELIRMRAGGP